MLRIAKCRTKCVRRIKITRITSQRILAMIRPQNSRSQPTTLLSPCQTKICQTTIRKKNPIRTSHQRHNKRTLSLVSQKTQRTAAGSRRMVVILALTRTNQKQGKSRIRPARKVRAAVSRIAARMSIKRCRKLLNDQIAKAKTPTPTTMLTAAIPKKKIDGLARKTRQNETPEPARMAIAVSQTTKTNKKRTVGPVNVKAPKQQIRRTPMAVMMPKTNPHASEKNLQRIPTNRLMCPAEMKRTATKRNQLRALISLLKT